ncbi:MAG TPA: tripartite tricarboxylate transporter substrate binding protein BugD [Candidatus Binatia bacterium]|jgi:tripartite-type tricarboxylate transporter receptor subunit TctC
MVKFVVRIAVCAFLIAASTTGYAQQYPAKVITLVVPYAAGGPTDTVARLVAHSMSATLKQQMIVENTVGAGGTIAGNRVAHAAPDGYTLFIHHVGHSTAPALYRKLPYDPINDFEPIGLINEAPMTLLSKKDLSPKNLKELIAYIKANKDKMTLANAGLGSASHLCGMLFMSAIQTDVTTVPYEGAGPAMNDLLGGQVDLLCDQTTNTTSQIKAGRVKVYGITSNKRVASLPDVPTMDEAGLKGFEVNVWHALYAPKGTPKAVIDKLVPALQAAIKEPNVKQRFNELGAESVAENRATPAALRAHLKAEIDRWGPIIKKAGVYAD